MGRRGIGAPGRGTANAWALTSAKPAPRYPPFDLISRAPTRTIYFFCFFAVSSFVLARMPKCCGTQRAKARTSLKKAEHSLSRMVTRGGKVGDSLVWWSFWWVCNVNLARHLCKGTIRFLTTIWRLNEALCLLVVRTFACLSFVPSGDRGFAPLHEDILLLRVSESAAIQQYHTADAWLYNSCCGPLRLVGGGWVPTRPARSVEGSVCFKGDWWGWPVRRYVRHTKYDGSMRCFVCLFLVLSKSHQHSKPLYTSNL